MDAQQLKDRIAALRERWRSFAGTTRGKRLIQSTRVVLTAVIIGYLVVRLTQIGWARVWTSLPTTPWFYLLFLAIYLTLPGFLSLVFGQIWGVRPRQAFLAMLKKRVYDKDVMSYSGDVYLYFWARRHLKRPNRRILHDIKDNAIVSSLISTILAIGLLVLFFLSGMVALPASFQEYGLLYGLGGLLVGGGLVGGILRFRRSLLKLPGQVLLAVAGLHLARLLTVQGLQVAEWAVVAPEVPLEIWFTFLAAQIIVSRIPLLPSRDLIFVGAGIELAAAVGAPTVVVAGMLLVHSMLDKVLNLLLFAALSLRERTNASGRSRQDHPPIALSMPETEVPEEPPPALVNP